MKRLVTLCLLAFILFSALSQIARAAQCQMTIVNEWNSGFTGSIRVTNDTGQELDGWRVSIQFRDATSITGMWNADLTGSSLYLATNKNYNASIKVNQSATFGFNAKKALANSPAASATLGGICVMDNSNQAPIPLAVASELSGSAPLTINFDGSGSSDPEGQALDYFWDFDDGNVSESVTPEHTFHDPGTYNVQLAVSDGEITAQAVKLSINVLNAPLTDANCEFKIVNEWGSGFTGQVTVFNDSEYPVEGWQVAMAFADETTISGVWNSKLLASKPYLVENANYNQTINPNGFVRFGFNAQKSIAAEPAVVPELGGVCSSQGAANLKPTAQVSVSELQGDAPLTVTLNGTGSSDPNGDVLSYLWTLNGEVISTSAQFDYTFLTPGTYPISLTVSDSELASETVITSIEVIEPTPLTGYQLNTAKSSLYFVSTKKVHVIETHSFTEIAGNISHTGEASLSINLNSVETGIDTRNQRMRDFLFETASFPETIVTLDVDLEQLSQIPIGSAIEQEVAPILDLHGVTVQLATRVKVTRLTATSLLVQNSLPIIINAADFDLTEGIEILRELASLSSISYAVPTNFTLVFESEL